MSAPVLVTGGAGFIGHHLVRALLARGERVRVLDDLSTGRAARLPEDPRVELLVGDVRDAALVERAARGTSTVWHLAGRGSVRDGDESEQRAVNVEGTRRVVAVARGPVVLASSAAVYGERSGPCPEDAHCRPIGAYGASKLAAEELARDAVVLRLFNVYGPGQGDRGPSAGVVSRFLSAARAGRPVSVFGDGRQGRDFVYIDDVVRSLLRAPEIAPGVVNVGSGVATCVLDLIDMVEQITGASLPRLHRLAPGPEVRLSLADTRHAAQVLGRVASTALPDGLALTLARRRRLRAAS